TPARTPSSEPSAASSSEVLPAPGALIRFTTATPARSKSARFARAIVLLASSASSTTRIRTLCTTSPSSSDSAGSPAPATRRRRRTPRRSPARCPWTCSWLLLGVHQLAEQLLDQRHGAVDRRRHWRAELHQHVGLLAAHVHEGLAGDH